MLRPRARLPAPPCGSSGDEATIAVWSSGDEVPAASRDPTESRVPAASAKIWIQPEDAKQLMPIFSNLSDVYLFNIFAECDLNWTLFILQAAPSLKNFYLSRHSCVINKTENIAEKTNLVWKPCNFKYLNLKLLSMKEFEEEEKVINYIRLFMERAMGLKKIELRDKIPCSKCKAINPESPRFLVDEDNKRRIREQLTYGFSSSPEIIIDSWI